MSARPDVAPRLAMSAQGLLRDFNLAGVLVAADVHVASRLGAIGGESDDAVLLAIALLVRSTRHGSVVLDLETAALTISPEEDDEGGGAALDIPLLWPSDWVRRCAASPLVSAAESSGSSATEGTGAGGAGTPMVGSPMVGSPSAPARPVRMEGSRLWLARYWDQEEQVARELLDRAATSPDDLDTEALAGGLTRLFGEHADADQRQAAAACALSWVSVLAGGPGTGKTTTVSRVLALLAEQHPQGRVALAAPTGKAAARLEEAVRSSTAHLPAADRDRLGELPAVTLHRLLGWLPGARNRFRHDRSNRLPFDVVVVDEASMVSLTMMARLLEALRPTTRLILVGDPDQLASVEAGAVLGDLVHRPSLGRRTPARAARLHTLLGRPDLHPSDGPVGPVGTVGADGTIGAPGTGTVGAPGTGTVGADGTVGATGTGTGGASGTDDVDGHAALLRDGVSVLLTNHRFGADSAIAALAHAVQAGDAPSALAVLRGGGEVEFVEVDDDAPFDDEMGSGVRADVETVGAALHEAAARGDAIAALGALERHRVLCAHRRGPRGVQRWGDLAASWIAERHPVTVRADGRYEGEPLLVTTNDYEAGLYNGDSGVVVRARADVEGDLVAVFGRGGAPILVSPTRLGSVRPLHAMTIHRSQGSQFDRVTVLLPLTGSPLGTRQTLYTAVTRAKAHVRIIGSAQAFSAAVERAAARATGLQERLARTRWISDSGP